MRDSFNTPNLPQHGAITDDDHFSDAASDTSSTLNDLNNPLIEQSQDSPLQLALDDLESRIVSSFNEFKSHSGRVTSTTFSSIHDELSNVLTPVLETASHVAPMNGRTICTSFPDVYDFESVMDTIYTKINSELVLPVLLESAQSEMNPPKRAASLRMFHLLFVEWNKSGSWLDSTSSNSSNATMVSTRKAELLKRWVQACIPNLMQTFTSEALDAGAAGRGVLSASAALKPCLRYMAERIAEADDAGALRLFLPVMRMIEKVLGRVFLEGATNSLDGGGENKENDALRSSCIKFLEIVVLCFSHKALPGMMAGGTLASRMKKDAAGANDFSLEDLPPGHPIITRENLEEIGEYAFTTLRGLVFLGGQAKIDPDLLRDAVANANASAEGMVGGSNPFQQILAIIKPAALAFQKLESDAEKSATNDDSIAIDRSAIEMDFFLSQKSYSISVNAIQLLATKRPLFFKEAATCLARRTMNPPEDSEGNLTKSAIVGIRTHLRSSCLTLLRHILSVTSGCSDILVKALSQCGMEAQAERALDASRKQLNLMKGGRAARTRAQIFYEWDTSTDLSRAKKRQRDTDDAEARVRAAKLARGLGSGIQLPTSMSDACELVLLNLKHLPSSRPPVPSSVQRSQFVNLDLVVDAVMSNGSALSIDENHWYDRDGGHAWTVEEGEMDEDGKKELIYQCKTTDEKERTKFAEQSRVAASKAFSRILASTSSNRSEVAANVAKKIAARLAWMLQDTKPDDNAEFAPRNPLVSSCLEYDINHPSGSESKPNISAELSARVLNEMYVSSLTLEEENVPPKKYYEECLDYYVSSVVNANNPTGSSNEEKRSANLAALALPHQLITSPSLTAASLNSVASFCDIEEISKKAAKTSKQSITESAALHSAKAAAEKRATAALIVLRDVAFQRDNMRGSAIGCAVAIAAGRLPASPPIQDKALKLVMNVIFQKNSDCATKVVESATRELEAVVQNAIDNHGETSKSKEGSEEEKAAISGVLKPVVLFMALCVRRPEIIKVIMEASCRDGADIMVKAVKANMPKLAKAAAAKHGAASIALSVAEMTSDKETPLLLSFLDNLAPANEKALPSQDLIDACHEIQRNKSNGDTKDSRYIIPIVSGMKRIELESKLPEFVQDSDETFKTSLKRMSERLRRYALIYRDEPDPKEPSLHGMSSCEQIVNLHRIDFNAIGLPQKRYLDAIRLCLEDDEMFSDRVIQAALDYISGQFLEGESLPLAYMRTIILTCSKHESLHSWICHVLLPRLVEGKVYTDKRQWEGWMRCAKMLENTGDQGVSSKEAISRLPPDQLEIYRTKYPKS